MRDIRFLIIILAGLSIPLTAFAADFQWQDSKGETHSLKDYHGQPLLLHFWATWCPPCRSELPELVEWRRQHPEVIFIPISLDENPAAARQYLQQYQLELTDNRGDNREAMQLGVRGLPSTFVIAGDSEIKLRLLGAQPWGDEAFSSALLEGLRHRVQLNTLR